VKYAFDFTPVPSFGATVQARKGFHGVNGKPGAKKHKFIHSFLPISAQGLPAGSVEGLPAVILAGCFR